MQTSTPFLLPHFGPSLWLRLAAALFLAFPIGQAQAQSLRDRFFVGLESSVNNPDNNLTAATSLAAEPRLWIVNKCYLGLKFDVPIGSLGDNHFDGYGEPILGTFSSLVLKGYFEQQLFFTKLYAGFGFGKYSGSDLPNQYTDQGLRFLAPDTLRLSSGWLREFALGVKGEHLYFGFSFKKILGNDAFDPRLPSMSTTVGISFGNGNRLTHYKKPIEYELPQLMLEFGQQLSAPLRTVPGAACRVLYADLKARISPRASIGARLADIPRDGYGTDAMGYDPSLVSQFPLSFPQKFRINTMKLIRSNTLFFDYYFPRKTGWNYLGAGFGWYRFEGLETLSLNGGPGSQIEVPGRPGADKAGALLRMGHKSGSFRAGFDLNLPGKGVPLYAGLHLGLELGLFAYGD